MKDMISYIDQKDYELLDLKVSNEKSCFIETFSEIGWIDPFPINPEEENDEKLSMPIRPMVAFALPSKRLMLNIIRACIGIKDPQLLWIN